MPRKWHNEFMIDWPGGLAIMPGLYFCLLLLLTFNWLFCILNVDTFFLEAVSMRIKIQKWGNSMALRIPKSFADQVSIKLGSSVDLSIQDGKIIIEPLKTEEYDLKLLVDAINEANLHNEYMVDEPRGKEIW
jgi:antitoxin MazE